jgi:intracellular septation protein
MSGSKKRFYPFNAEQTVNILSEFGPLVLMFVVNAIHGIDAGTWALIISTVVAIAAMRIVLKRLPVFPLIASSVTIVFGALTLITGDAMWIQIKVTIFNILFAAFLLGGLALNQNFFKYVFEKTFHYTKEGWDRFTWSFAWFFILTAVLNELVRWAFPPPPHGAMVACKQLAGAVMEQCLDRYRYAILGQKLDGVNIWILFKVALIMPMSGIYAWVLTRQMQKYRIPDDQVPQPQDERQVVVSPAGVSPRSGGLEFAKVPVESKLGPKQGPGSPTIR